MRIDKLLWQLRLTKSRSLAHALVETGYVRRNGARVLRASQDVAAGDVLTVPLPGSVRVIEILALPVRFSAEMNAVLRRIAGRTQGDVPINSTVNLD